MKTKLPLIAALCCGLSSVGSAFTLDFLNYSTGNPIPNGTPVPPTLVINVPGYGNVQFDVVPGSVLVVDNSFENDGPGQTTSPSLNFDMGEAVTVTFLGNTPLNVDFDYVGVNAGEYFLTSQDAPNVFTLALNGQGNGAGLYQIGFNQVPEPSASLLGIIGGALLVLRRRR